MWQAIAAIAAPVVSSIVGNHLSAGDRELAEHALQDAYNTMASIGAPPDLSKEIILKKLEQVGLLTPQLEQDISAGMSKVAQISEKPELMTAQMKALESLGQLGRTGLRPEDRAMLNQLKMEQARDTEAKMQQIQQGLAQRGMAGSGAEIAAQIATAQSEANRASEQSERVAAMASQRALEALQRSGSLATNIRGQEFDIARAKAGAEDEFKRFDVANQIARQRANIDRANVAKEFNIREQQRVSDENIRMSNQELLRQAQAKRDYWQDQLSRSRGIAGAQEGMSKYYSDRASGTQAAWGQIGSAIGQGISAFSKPSSGKEDELSFEPKKDDQLSLDEQTARTLDRYPDYKRKF